MLFFLVSTLLSMGVTVSSLQIPNPLMNPRFQLTSRFIALKAKGNVEAVLATPKWPDTWPFTENDLRRQDETNDKNFYSAPRFCYHVDEKAVAALTDYYAAEFPKLVKKEGEKPAILDLCASHVSHFPKDVSDYTGKRVALGMNEEELKDNSQVDEYFVQDLNENPILPFEDNSFDVVTNAVSIDYLNRPLEICKEVARVLKPGGTAMFALSNRCFPSKAIGLWLQTNDLEHVFIVGSYFHYTGMFKPPTAVEVGPNPIWVGGQSQNVAYLSVVRATVDK
eukprot:CAMPEP_0194133866 /NCGR_PEP_ID=MMETSP0152-20130528/3883_1 /TAXON_ID=1049557 /ORGANISM="Thalassiothrix antarctica, Strain L6-D1" /LENGTH=279 /DNA_ID=CAMNT_0038829261 /DNA_START=78 /DNA_END=917 /DNA_ORIENTATION=-